MTCNSQFNLAIRLAFAGLVALLAANSAAADDGAVTVVMWNVESGGANIQSIAKKCTRLEGVDILGLSEVASEQWVDAIDKALEASEAVQLSTVVGTTGNNDKLVFVFDDSELDLLEWSELDNVNTTGFVRAPLVCRFRHTATGTDFLVCVNHLYRSRDAERHRQAQLLNDWARSMQLPVILGGDMNFDWSVAHNGKQRDKGFDNLIAGGVVEWVRPSKIVKTHSSNYNSILDFIFVTPNGPWTITGSEIIVEDGDFPDTGWTSDHRPVTAVFKIGSSQTSPGSSPSQNTTSPSPTNSAGLESALRSLERSIESLRAEAEKLDEQDPRQRAMRRRILGRLERMQRDADALRELLEESSAD